jgi:hypothetical protein
MTMPRIYTLEELEDLYEDDDYELDDDYQEYDLDGEVIAFAEPGGESALRAATAANPRNLPCPTCGEPNRLTPADAERGYQCNRCADLEERGGW